MVAANIVQRCRNLLTTESKAISFPTIPPSQSMVGDPRVAALVRLRREGLRSEDRPAWTKLLRCVRLLSLTLPVWELHL